MPKPPHLCSCGRTVPHGSRCPCKVASTRARNNRHDARRPTASQRGYGSAWRKARTEFLKYHKQCAGFGCKTTATVVDHIIPHKGDEALFWDRSNWQPLCTSCHSRHKQRQERSL